MSRNWKKRILQKCVIKSVIRKKSRLTSNRIFEETNVTNINRVKKMQNMKKTRNKKTSNGETI